MVCSDFVRSRSDPDAGFGALDLRRLAVTCVILAFPSILGCNQTTRQPGTPPATRSPLFRGLESYQTLDQAAKNLPNQEMWKVVIDSKSHVRQGCPRFDEFTFDVPETDLGQTGTLRVQFINGRLAAALFTPTDFPAYVDGLRRAGIVLKSEEAHLPPATFVWSSHTADGRPFVGWRDERFAQDITAFIERCS
jgi:hypothetical protein